jgi:hypothetical protein
VGKDMGHKDKITSGFIKIDLFDSMEIYIETRVLYLNEFLEYLDLISIGSLSHCFIELGMVVGSQ